MKKIIAAFLLLILLGCFKKPAVKENKTVIQQNPSSPFEIEIQYQNHILSAFIKNKSGKNQLYFYDFMVQPARIVLIYEGKELQSFDKRQIMKYNNTVEKEMFKSISPNEKKKLYESRLVSGSSFDWGTYKFKDIPGGRYQVFLEWRSFIGGYYDRQSQKYEKIDVWTDENPIYSNEMTVDL